MEWNKRNKMREKFTGFFISNTNFYTNSENPAKLKKVSKNNRSSEENKPL